jgi:hypoxanthine phosphoribosyltransferase
MKNVLFTSEQIQDKVTEIAHAIDFKHTSNDDVVMICVLNGGFMFFSDLVKHMSTNVEIDFIRAKSYNGQDQGVVHITKDIETNIEGKHVYVVDDFYDTGNTLNRILEHLSTQNPKSLEIVTLLTRDISPIPDYPHMTGFMVKDEWVVGYGMDNDKKERNLDYIYAL